MGIEIIIWHAYFWESWQFGRHVIADKDYDLIFFWQKVGGYLCISDEILFVQTYVQQLCFLGQIWSSYGHIYGKVMAKLSQINK